MFIQNGSVLKKSKQTPQAATQLNYSHSKVDNEDEYASDDNIVSLSLRDNMLSTHQNDQMPENHESVCFQLMSKGPFFLFKNILFVSKDFKTSNLVASFADQRIFETGLFDID
jgi:hypothetical protein